MIALERAGNLLDGEPGGDARRETSGLEQGAVWMPPGSGVLGQFLFRVGIELLKGNDVGLEGLYVFEQFLFALRLFGESIPDVVAQDPELGTLCIRFRKELNGEQAKQKKQE